MGARWDREIVEANEGFSLVRIRTGLVPCEDLGLGPLGYSISSSVVLDVDVVDAAISRLPCLKGTRQGGIHLSDGFDGVRRSFRDLSATATDRAG